MTLKIDYEYYEWLVSQIDIPNGKKYRDLFELMHNIEFVWHVPNDDNRVQDGLDLRKEFSPRVANSLIISGATFLEVLIALSRRVAFTAGGNASLWAWRLIKNLRLHKKSDPLDEMKVELVNDILHNVIWRLYERNGRGGFFPLTDSLEDQTKVEIWYQMNTYIREMKEHL